MHPKNQAESLLDKYLRNECNDQERILVERFYLETLSSDQFKLSDPKSSVKKVMWESISSAISTRKRFRIWPMATAAAAMLLFGVYIFYDGKGLNNRVRDEKDFLAAVNKATITLPGGKIIELESSRDGVKVDRDGLSYNDGSKLNDAHISLNRAHQAGKLLAATPRGGTYRFTLPDGTGVWLNADSKLSFPEYFPSEGPRAVFLEGEAYFEVFHDKSHPFIVSTPKQSVRVLGTHFDVNAYSDEPIEKTVLSQGSVQVNGKMVLRPGEQSLVRSRDNIRIAKADLDVELAWKNGVFVFNDAPLENIMRQVSRWYDIEVVYTRAQNGETYNGTINRKADLSRILNILRKGGVKFELNGKTLQVTP